MGKGCTALNWVVNPHIQQGHLCFFFACHKPIPAPESFHKGDFSWVYAPDYKGQIILIDSFLLSVPFLDLAAYDMAKSKINLNLFEEIPNINPVTIKAIVSFLAETDVHDADSEEQRFKKPFVQSNALTDKLAADARVLNSVNTAVVALEGKKSEQSFSCFVNFNEIPVFSKIFKFLPRFR